MSRVYPPYSGYRGSEVLMHGSGSYHSPIVIDDEDDEGEDEAFVELELERRLASPRGDMEYEDWDDEDPDDAMMARLWSGREEMYYDYAPDEVATPGTPPILFTVNRIMENFQDMRSLLRLTARGNEPTATRS